MTSRVVSRDSIEIDARKEVRAVNLLISDGEMQERKAAWSAPPLKATRGALYKYIKCVSCASTGCVTDE